MAWTSPRTWVAAEIPTAATLNTHIRDNLKAIGDAWGSYAPTYTNFSLGNGTVAAAYLSAGKLTHYRGLITLGGSSSVSGNIRISLPVPSFYSTFGRPLNGVVELNDATGGRAFWTPVHQSGTEFYIADADDTRTSATAPFTWATGDAIAWSLTYEAA